MKLFREFLVMLVLTASFVMVLGCSNGKSPIDPSLDDFSEIIDNLPEAAIMDNHNRTPLAIYDAVIDPVAGTFAVTPVSREAQYHFPLTQLYPNCLQVTGYGWTPNFWADIKLTHPLLGSGIDAFDPRVIAILPTHLGSYFYYPSEGIYGNPGVILQPDGYTKLFDELAPELFGNVNPFVAYFKDQQYRRWSSVNYVTETKRWDMNLDAFGGSLTFKLVVDVSTNYPDSPMPVTDNAPEPIDIIADYTEGLTQYGGSSIVTANFIKWHGDITLGNVFIEAPALFNGKVNMSPYSSGPGDYEFTYKVTINNSKLAPAGTYNYLIGARDERTGSTTYSHNKLTVRQASRELVWAKQAGGISSDQGRAVATFSDNSFIVAGFFSGNAKFGYPDEPTQVDLTSMGFNDIFIARYNPDGTLQWAKQAGGNEDDYPYGVTVLADDTFVVTGAFNLSATFGQGEPNQTILPSSGSTDMFVARYNSDGTLRWAKKAGGTGVDYGVRTAVVKNTDCYVAGQFSGSATFGQGEPTETTLTAGGERDVFIARYTKDGNLAWAKSIEGSYGATFVNGLSSSPLIEGVILTGEFLAFLTFDKNGPNETMLHSAGFSDAYFAKFSNAGAFEWAKRAGGGSDDGGADVKHLSDDKFCATGYFSGTATFGPGERDEVILTSNGSGDIFVALFFIDNGNLKWAKGAGGVSFEYGSAIAAISANAFAVTGSYFDTLTFGQGEPNETTLQSYDTSNSFLAVYNDRGSLEWAKQCASSNSGRSQGISILSDSSMIITGVFSNTGSFGIGDPYETQLDSYGNEDIFIARFAP